jgi:hypothetical protein
MGTSSMPPNPPRAIWLLVRDGDPEGGEWFASQRKASLKATWLRERHKATVVVLRAVVDVGPTSSDA